MLMLMLMLMLQIGLSSVLCGADHNENKKTKHHHKVLRKAQFGASASASASASAWLTITYQETKRGATPLWGLKSAPSWTIRQSLPRLGIGRGEDSRGRRTNTVSNHGGEEGANRNEETKKSGAWEDRKVKKEKSNEWKERAESWGEEKDWGFSTDWATWQSVSMQQLHNWVLLVARMVVSGPWEAPERVDGEGVGSVSEGTDFGQKFFLNQRVYWFMV